MIIKVVKLSYREQLFSAWSLFCSWTTWLPLFPAKFLAMPINLQNSVCTDFLISKSYPLVLFCQIWAKLRQFGLWHLHWRSNSIHWDWVKVVEYYAKLAGKPTKSRLFEWPQFWEHLSNLKKIIKRIVKTRWIQVFIVANKF